MKYWFLAAALSLAAGALGDIVHLNDGTSVEGTVRRTREGYVVTDAAGKTTTIPFESVRSFELKSSTSASNADDRLGSLRRAVGNLDDIKQIIERYKTFVAQTKGTPAGAQAEKDLAQWQDRLDKKMVKAGKEWVTPEQAEALRASAKASVAKVVPLVTAGQLKEAMAAVDQSLAVAPNSGDLLYLKGVVLTRQNQTVPARNAYQSAAAQMPDHGPSHNNIAVILWRTRQLMPAMLEFEKAMNAMPMSQTILDNVAEALHGLPDEYKKNELTKRVVALFNTQDAALQREMAQKGFYRWGSQWLDAQQYGVIDAQKKAVQEKVDVLQKEFDTNRANILKMTQQIAEDQSMLRLMEQQSVGADAQGNLIRFPLPTRYYDIQREQASLQGELQAKQIRQNELSKLATEEAKHAPQPTYGGAQKYFDLDGLPSNVKSAAGIGQTPRPGAATAPARADGSKVTAGGPAPGTRPAGSQVPTTRPGGGDY